MLMDKSTGALSGGPPPFERAELERPVTERFEKVAAACRDRLAVKGGRHAYTYGELDEAANRIAHALIAELGEGQAPVVVLLENDAPVAAATLGLQKARKIAVPIHSSYPRDRIAFIMQDVRAGLVLTDARDLPLARALAADGCRVLDLDALDPALPCASPGLPVSADDLVAIFYTSGSTGRPKGVVHCHRHMTHEALVAIEALRMGVEDRVAELHSPGFSASIRRLYPALLSGGSLHIYDVSTLGVAGLARWIAEEGITIYGMRSVFLDLIDTLTGRERFPALRVFRFGGDKVLPSFIDQVRRLISRDCEIFVNYGSTEAGSVAHWLIPPGGRVEGDSVPVGEPADDTEVTLVGEDGAPVAPGEVGEFVVRSRHLARGYWERPDLTAGAFAPDPDGADRRSFHTGDLGRLRPDGLFEHLGRKDFQVKVRGFRVEIGEVEEALSRLPSVRQAVVVGLADQAGSKRLVAYVVPAPGQAPTVTAMRRALAERLPEYMVPSAFVLMEGLPLTATGKVDRRALPPPGRRRPDIETPYAPCDTPLQAALAQVWCGVIGLDAVGANDSFFELGGHSLAAAQVISRLREAFGVDVPLQAFFAAPTVAGLADALLARWTARMSGSELADVLGRAEGPPRKEDMGANG
jgi:amino acid adenylation domain-containing protein